jgi:hypothetical protein
MGREVMDKNFSFVEICESIQNIILSSISNPQSIRYNRYNNGLEGLFTDSTGKRIRIIIEELNTSDPGTFKESGGL